MPNQEQIQQAIESLEKNRATLGPQATDLALGSLRALLAAPALPQTGERRTVTVMFADISGFTAISERTDPEDLRALINAAFERLVPCIEQNGGTVEKFIGDEIMAIFGAPLAHENDAERAARTALEMMAALNAFNRERGLTLGMHIGINTGTVIAGMLGTRHHQQYGVLGDTVNVASRLEDASERGEIFVGPDTYRLTGPMFEYEALEPLRLKGKSQPVQVFRLLGVKSRPGSLRGLEAQGIRSPLVGRGDALGRLVQGLAQTAAGKGGIVGVIAEAGLGKSRLLAEARQDAEGLNLRWLEGRALSFGQAISYWPVRELIRQAVEIGESESEPEARAKLERRVTALFGEQAGEVLPYLASLLALEPESVPDAARALGAEALGRQIAVSVRRAMEAMAAAQPLALIFEDLHWADESSVGLLESILPLVRSSALLIVVVIRPDFQTPGGRLLGWMMQEYHAEFTGLWLEPLSRRESMNLLENLLPGDALPPRVREMILERAEGNPFYVEEVIRVLIALGAVVRDPVSELWQATTQIERINIPETVQGVIMARVDRLPERLKRVLRVAAVIGRTFPFRILRELEQGPRELGEMLDELKELELIGEKSRMPELLYAFKNAATCDAIYESILLQERRALHARIGTTLEAQAADRLEQIYSLLAYHFARAENWQKAQDYLLKAGNQARQMAADAEALAHYRQALELYSRVQGQQWNPLDRARLELNMAEAYFRRGEHAQATETLQHVLAAAGGALPQQRGKIWVEAIHQGAIQFIHRVFPFIPLLPPVGLRAESFELRVRALEMLAWIDVWNQPERAALETLSLLNLAETMRAPVWEQVGAGGMGYMFSLGGLHRLARSYHTRSIALAEKINQPASLGTAHQMSGSSAILAARWEMAIDSYRKAARAYEQTGNPRGQGLSLMGAAIARRYRGEYGQAMELSRQTLQLGRAVADAQVLGWGLHGMGLIGLRTGSLPEQEALRLVEEALDAYRSIPDYSGMVYALGDLGQATLRQGRLKKALQLQEEARKVIQEHGVRAMNATPAYNGLAAAYLYAAEREIHPAERAAWLKKAHLACGQAARHARVDVGGLAEVQRLWGGYEWLRGNQSAARNWWKTSAETAKRYSQPYEAALAYAEMGRRMAWREYLTHAETILQKTGALYDLARVREWQDGLTARG